MGHSLGEYNALFAGNWINIEEGIELLHLRGKLMSNFLDSTKFSFSMVAIKVRKTKEEEFEFLIEKEKDFSIACYNSGEEYVLSGYDIHRWIRANPSMIRSYSTLPSKIPFHSPWLEDVASQFRRNSITISTKKCDLFPVISNTTSLPFDGNTNIIELLSRHICSPVLWKQSILFLKKNYIIDEVLPFGGNNLMKNLWNSQ